MPVSKKKKFAKKRKSVVKQDGRDAGKAMSGAVLIRRENDDTFTVTDKQTGAVLLSGLDAEKTGMLLANNFADYAAENSPDIYKYGVDKAAFDAIRDKYQS